MYAIIHVHVHVSETDNAIDKRGSNDDDDLSEFITSKINVCN